MGLPSNSGVFAIVLNERWDENIHLCKRREAEKNRNRTQEHEPIQYDSVRIRMRLCVYTVREEMVLLSQNQIHPSANDKLSSIAHSVEKRHENWERSSEKLRGVPEESQSERKCAGEHWAQTTSFGMSLTKKRRLEVIFTQHITFYFQCFCLMKCQKRQAIAKVNAHTHNAK